MFVNEVLSFEFVFIGRLVFGRGLYGFLVGRYGVGFLGIYLLLLGDCKFGGIV